MLTSEVGEPSRRGGRPRRYYRGTPEGVRSLEEFREMWRRVWSGFERAGRVGCPEPSSVGATAPGSPGPPAGP